MMGRRVDEGGYDGEESYGKEDYFLEGENIWKGEWISVWIFSGVESLILGVLVNHCRGTGLLGVLGTGARIPFGFLELGSQTGCS
jgi:hypothetical protein